MSNVISGSSIGPGGSSVSGVGNGSNRGSVENISGSFGSGSNYSRSSDSVANDYNMYMANTARRYYEDDKSDYMNYNSLMYNTALAFSREMSNTAIQRQVKDLIAAGLNPVLAARLGGASYSLPSAPYMGSPTYQNMPYYDSSISRNRESLASQKEIAEMNNITSELNNIRTNATNMSMNELTNSTNIVMNELTNLVSRANNIDNNDKAVLIAYMNNETDKYIEEYRQSQENRRNIMNLSKSWSGLVESTLLNVFGVFYGNIFNTSSEEFIRRKYGLS